MHLKVARGITLDDDESAGGGDWRGGVVGAGNGGWRGIGCKLGKGKTGAKGEAKDGKG